MKTSKLFLAMAVAGVLCMFSTDLLAQDQEHEYAYICVRGKLLSKKLKVHVDLGDSREQIKMGDEFSQLLTNKKSFAAVLNHMVKNNFELVETLDYTSTADGTGGTSGVVFIMRKKK